MGVDLDYDHRGSLKPFLLMFLIRLVRQKWQIAIIKAFLLGKSPREGEEADSDQDCPCMGGGGKS